MTVSIDFKEDVNTTLLDTLCNRKLTLNKETSIIKIVINQRYLKERKKGEKDQSYYITKTSKIT